MPVAPSPCNLRIAIPEDELPDLYVAQRLTIEQIAARFGLAPTTVSRRFADLGIRARPCGIRASSRYGAADAQMWQWTAKLAYAVGLIATDGNLSSDGRHLSIPSKDLDLLETLRGCLGLTNSITRYSGGRGNINLYEALCLYRLGQSALRAVATDHDSRPHRAFRRAHCPKIVPSP